MADTKITALAAITTVDPAADVLPIVDISDTSMAASGTTKKITSNQILGAGGTATLASATITGDLTVDTSTLKVDSTNNRVGIGTASPTAALHVSSSGSVHLNQRTGGNGCFTQYIDPVSSNYVGTDSGNFRVANNSAQDLLNIQQLGVFTFGDGAGGTRMTLNANGLGIGVTPSASKLQVAGNIGLPNSCTASGETSGVFSIDVANLLTLTGGNWRQASILLVYSGVNTDLSNPTVLQTVVTLTGLATWDTISKNDIVGTASVAVSSSTTTGARITVTVPTGNSGTVYAVLLGGAGGTTRPSMTINA